MWTIWWNFWNACHTKWFASMIVVMTCVKCRPSQFFEPNSTKNVSTLTYSCLVPRSLWCSFICASVYSTHEMEIHELLFSRGAFSELHSEKILRCKKRIYEYNILEFIVHSLLVYGSYWFEREGIMSVCFIHADWVDYCLAHSYTHSISLRVYLFDQSNFGRLACKNMDRQVSKYIWTTVCPNFN